MTMALHGSRGGRRGRGEAWWRRAGALAVGVATALVTSALPAVAAPGDLDTSFGTGGKVTTDFGGSPSQPDIGNALAIQPSDGKIVVVGRAGINAPGVGGTAEFGLARYNTNGSLDTSFGASSPVPGTVTTAFFPAPNTNFARAVAIQPSDGKIVAAGLAGPNEQTASVAIARYNTDGTLDGTFGTGGKVTVNVSGGLGDGIRGLAIRPNGKIVGVGAAGPNSLVIQFNTNGTLDTSFGAGTGFVTPNFGLIASHLFATALKTNGTLYAGGLGNDTGFNGFLLARFNTNGTLDTSFGSPKGFVVTHLSSLNDLAFGLALTSATHSGKVVLAGVANSTDPFNISGSASFGLARYNGDGTLDTTFGTAGKVTTKVSAAGRVDEARTVTIQPSDGKIVAAGEANTTSAFPVDPVDGHWEIIRYNTDGTLDSTFGTGGKVATTFGGGGDSARGVAVDSTGKIVVGGGATVTKPDGTQGLDFAAARYLAS